jgi:hypothetical protein
MTNDTSILIDATEINSKRLADILVIVNTLIDVFVTNLINQLQLDSIVVFRLYQEIGS